MPTAVLMMIGQIEVMKITKIAEGLLSRKAASEIGNPGQRRNGAHHLEDRIETAHRPDRLADNRADQHTHHTGKTKADCDTLKRREDAKTEPDVLRSGDKERIDDQVLGIGPDTDGDGAASRPASCRGSARCRRSARA